MLTFYDIIIYHMSTQKFLSPTYIKVHFFKSLKDIVENEIKSNSSIVPLASGAPLEEDSICLDCSSDFSAIKNLKSVLRASIVRRGTHLNPYYLSNHKSLLGDLIFTVIHEHKNEPGFKTYAISCAGSDSKAVTALKRYIEDTYKLTESSSADLRIAIARTGRDWEISVGLTPRPLSVRSYRLHNIEGGINPTIAYAMNTLGGAAKVSSYLNIFSGSGTLLIEAAQQNSRATFVGFDHSKEAATAAIRNIQNAGFIKNIAIKVADLFSRPDFGTFDLITADLPFGMKIDKGGNLLKLYTEFLAYSEVHMKPYGKIVAYTSDASTFKKALTTSKFTVQETREITIVTSMDSFLTTHIFVCALKK